MSQVRHLSSITSYNHYWIFGASEPVTCVLGSNPNASATGKRQVSNDLLIGINKQRAQGLLLELTLNVRQTALQLGLAFHGQIQSTYLYT